ncbi:MAG: DbpA RNA binding domain-containing protein [Sphaerochaetaceae bacterium]
MSFFEIPSLLQSKLNKLYTEGNSDQPLLIEVAHDVTQVVVSRALQLTLNGKTESSKTKTSANHPHTLLLLNQQLLDYLKQSNDSRIKSSFVLLSENSLPKDDLQVLKQKGIVLVTTPQRAIDHLRRDNLFLDATTSVIVAYDFLKTDKPEELNSEANAFLDDCRFIFTKLSPNVHIELYTEKLQNLTREPHQIFANPIVVAQSDWEKSYFQLVLYVATKLSLQSILEILYALGESSYLIIHKTGSRWYPLKSKIEKAILPLEVTGIGFERLSTLKLTSSTMVDTVVTVDLDEEQLLTTIRHLTDLEFPFNRIVAITGPREAQAITASKETLLMNKELKLTPQANEVLTGQIKIIVEKLNVDSNPQELENLKKIIKKSVPFYRRNYFSAYLLRELVKTQTIKGVATKTTTAPTPKKERPEKPSTGEPTNGKTLYINIGKMRRLYPKELSQIFQDKLGISRSDIFAIRVYDKYSFITLSEENAQRAIEELNGTEIRGRTASISYSNK